MNKSIVLVATILLLPVFGYANSAYEKALFFLRAPQYDSAYHYLQIANKSLSPKSSLDQYTSCLIRLGEMEGLFSESRKAMLHLREAEGILRRWTFRKDLLADCYEQLGQIYENIDDIEIAYKYYFSALRLKLELYGENDARTGYAYIKITKYYSFKQLQDSANFFSRKALAICLQDSLHQPLINLGEVMVGYAYEWKNCQPPDMYHHDSLYQAVREFYKSSIDYLHARYSRPTLEEARIYQGWANSYADYLAGNFKEFPAKAAYNFRQAKLLYEQSLKLKIELLGTRNPQVATTYYTLALLHRDHPGWDFKRQSLAYYQQAVYSLTADAIPDNDFTLPRLAQVRFPYYLNVLITNKVVLLEDMYKATGDTMYARIIHEHNRYRLQLWDQIIRTFESSETSQVIRIWNGTPFETAVESAFRMFRLTRDSSYLFEIYPIAERGRNNEFLELVIRSGKFNFNTSNSEGSAVTSLKEFQKILKSTESSFLEFIPAPTNDRIGSYALYITSDNYRLIRLCSMQRIDSLDTELSEAMRLNDARKYEAAGFALYNELIHKTVGALPGKLIISTTGSLSSIPFEALPVSLSITGIQDFRRLDYMMKYVEVGYALSATILRQQVNRRTTTTSGIVAFSPCFSQLSNLPFSANLVQSLSEVWKGSFYEGSSASKKKFLQVADQAVVLHVATHADANKMFPELSPLYFAGNVDDSLLLGELYGIKLPNELTVVSACESAQGRMEYAEGLKSFSRAFAYAGSKSTISTLWKVDDRTTAEVLLRFYGYLGQGQEKSASLRMAKLDYLKQCRTSESSNPFYWSGLILTGDPSPIRLEKKTAWWKWYAVSATLIVLFAVVFYQLRKK